VPTVRSRASRGSCGTEMRFSSTRQVVPQVLLGGEESGSVDANCQGAPGQTEWPIADSAARWDRVQGKSLAGGRDSEFGVRKAGTAGQPSASERPSVRFAPDSTEANKSVVSSWRLSVRWDRQVAARRPPWPNCSTIPTRRSGGEPRKREK
jgi:hypothetical protein